MTDYMDHHRCEKCGGHYMSMERHICPITEEQREAARMESREASLVAAVAASNAACTQLNSVLDMAYLTPEETEKLRNQRSACWDAAMEFNCNLRALRKELRTKK